MYTTVTDYIIQRWTQQCLQAHMLFLLLLQLRDGVYIPTSPIRVGLWLLWPIKWGRIDTMWIPGLGQKTTHPPLGSLGTPIHWRPLLEHSLLEHSHETRRSFSYLEAICQSSDEQFQLGQALSHLTFDSKLVSEVFILEINHPAPDVYIPSHLNLLSWILGHNAAFLDS